MADFTPTHPGEILAEEFLGPMGISAYRLAKEIDVPQTRLRVILAGRRSIPRTPGCGCRGPSGSAICSGSTCRRATTPTWFGSRSSTNFAHPPTRRVPGQLQF